MTGRYIGFNLVDVSNRLIRINIKSLETGASLWLTLNGSNNPCLEQIYMVPKMFQLLRSEQVCRDCQR